MGFIRKRIEQNTVDHTTPNGDIRYVFYGLVDKRILESRLTFFELKCKDPGSEGPRRP
jgi:hypothetical protein